MTNQNEPIHTAFTQLMGIKYPIIGAPMFLVSNEDMVIEVSNAGGLGTFPALNFRPTDRYADAIKKIKKSSDKPIGVNIIVNKSNRRQSQDLKIALDNGVDLFVTSLGNPKTVIEEAHKIGAKVICDVTNLEHAKKVEDLGADGVVAVSAGAGGHAGPTNPFVLIPWLKKELHIPIIAAGGVAHGSALLAALALGASAVHVGTRFIASTEASIPIEYKNAIIDATPDDIILTPRITGTPATYINNEYLKSLSKDLPFAVKWLKENPRTKKYIVPLVHYMGYKIFEKAISSPHKAPVWSAGQSSGLVNEILPCKEIIDRLVTEFWEAKNNV